MQRFFPRVALPCIDYLFSSKWLFPKFLSRGGCSQGGLFWSGCSVPYCACSLKWVFPRVTVPRITFPLGCLCTSVVPRNAFPGVALVPWCACSRQCLFPGIVVPCNSCSLENLFPGLAVSGVVVPCTLDFFFVPLNAFFPRLCVPPEWLISHDACFHVPCCSVP